MSEAELNLLPVGSVILDLGRDRSEYNAPVIACKASDGRWQIMGQPQGALWESSAVVDASKRNVVIVAYNPDN